MTRHTPRQCAWRRSRLFGKQSLRYLGNSVFIRDLSTLSEPPVDLDASVSVIEREAGLFSNRPIHRCKITLVPSFSLYNLQVLLRDLEIPHNSASAFCEVKHMTTIFESKVDLKQGISSHVIAFDKAIRVKRVGTGKYLLNELVKIVSPQASFFCERMTLRELLDLCESGPVNRHDRKMCYGTALPYSK